MAREYRLLQFRSLAYGQMGNDRGDQAPRVRVPIAGRPEPEAAPVFLQEAQSRPGSPVGDRSQATAEEPLEELTVVPALAGEELEELVGALLGEGPYGDVDGRGEGVLTPSNVARVQAHGE